MAAKVRSGPGAGKGRRPSPVPTWVPDDLPRGPGVYEFVGAGGTVLYVGKSVDLRRRVRGWFHGGGPADPRLAEMLALARAVRILPVGSDLEARIEEAERIVAARPPYNRALKNRARGWYVEIDWRDPFPRPRVVRAARRRGARHFGPLRGRAGAERVARLAARAFGLRECPGRVRPDPAASPCLSHGLGLCSGPCAREIGLDGYRARVERAVDALAGPDAAAAARASLVEERDRASAELAFERAARLQRRIEWLDELESLRPELDGRTPAGTWLLALPAARPRRTLLVPFVGGRVFRRSSVAWGGTAWREGIAGACRRARLAALRVPAAVEPAAVAVAGIVSDWLSAGSPDGLALRIDRMGDDRVADRIAVWRGGQAPRGNRGTTDRRGGAPSGGDDAPGSRT